MNDQVLAVVGLVVGPLLGYWSTSLTAKAKQKSDVYGHQGDQVFKLMTRVDELQAKMDAEIEHRRVAPYQNHLLKMALEDAVIYMEKVTAWIEAGCEPPPPDVPDIQSIRGLLESDDG